METALVSIDPQRLAAFYRDALGFAVERVIVADDDRFESAGLGSPCEITYLTTSDGSTFKLLAARAGAQASPRDAAAVLDAPGRPVLTLFVDDLVARTAAVKAAGGADLGDGGVITTGSGRRVGFFADPEGNALELIQLP